MNCNRFLNKWDYRFVRLAEEAGSWSKDPNRKVGCVLVNGKRDIFFGYNGFPESLSDDLTRLSDSEFKGKVIIHAEVNAVINAGRSGFTTEGCSVYTTYHPCSACASILIQAGVKKVICPPPFLGSLKRQSDFKIASDIMYEAKLKVLYYYLENEP